MTTLRNLLEQEGFQRIPLHKLKTGHYCLEIFVNGTPGIFILDTGASNSCICLDYIQYFNLTIEETEIKASGAGAMDMETKVAKNNKIAISSISLNKQYFVLFNMIHVNNALTQAGEQPVHGIMGGDMLKLFRGVIDYGRNCVYLKR